MAEKWKQKPEDEGISAPLKALTRKEVQKGPHFARYQFLKTAAETVSERSAALAAYLGGKATQCVLDCRLDIQRRELASQCSRCGVPLKPCNCSSVQVAILNKDEPGGGHPGILRICKVCEEENWTRCATMKGAEEVAAAEEAERQSNREMSTLLFIQSQGGQPQGSPGNVGVSFDALPVISATQPEGKKEGLDHDNNETIDLTSSPERPSREPEEPGKQTPPLSLAKRESAPSVDVGPTTATENPPPSTAAASIASRDRSPWKSDIPLAGGNGSGARNGGPIVRERVVVEGSTSEDQEQSLDYFFNDPRDVEEETSSRHRSSDSMPQGDTQVDPNAANPKAVDETDPQEPNLQETQVSVTLSPNDGAPNEQSDPTQAPPKSQEATQATNVETQEATAEMSNPEDPDSAAREKREGPGPSPKQSPSSSNNKWAPDILFPRRSEGLDPTDCVSAEPHDLTASEPQGAPSLDNTSGNKMVEDQNDDETVMASKDAGDIAPLGENSTDQKVEDGAVMEESGGNDVLEQDRGPKSEVEPEEGGAGREKDRVDATPEPEVSAHAGATEGSVTIVGYANPQVPAEDAMDVEKNQGHDLGGSPPQEEVVNATIEGQDDRTAITTESAAEGTVEVRDVEAATPGIVVDETPSENVIEGTMDKEESQPASTPEAVQEDAPSENAVEGMEKEEGPPVATGENVMEADRIDGEEPQIEKEEEKGLSTATAPTPCDARETFPTAQLDVTGQLDVSHAAESKKFLEQVSENAGPSLDGNEQVQANVETKKDTVEVEPVEGSVGGADNMETDGISKGIEEEDVVDGVDIPAEEEEEGVEETDKQTDKECENRSDGGGVEGPPDGQVESRMETEEVQLQNGTRDSGPTSAQAEEKNPRKHIGTEPLSVEKPVALTQLSNKQTETAVQVNPDVRSVQSQKLVSLESVKVQTKKLRQKHVRIQTQVKQRSKMTQATPPAIAVKDSGVGCDLKEKCANIGVQVEVEAPVVVPKFCDMGIQCLLLETGDAVKKDPVGEKGTTKKKESVDVAGEKETTKKKKKKRSKRKKVASTETAPQASKRCKTGEEKQQPQKKSQEDRPAVVEASGSIAPEKKSSKTTKESKKNLKKDGKSQEDRPIGVEASGSITPEEKSSKTTKESKKNLKKDGKSQGGPKPSSSMFDSPEMSIPGDIALPPKKKVSWRVDERSKGKSEGRIEEEQSGAFRRNLAGSIGDPFSEAKTYPSGDVEKGSKKGKKNRKRDEKKTDADKPPAEQAQGTVTKKINTKKSPCEDANDVAEGRRESKRKRKSGEVTEALDGGGHRKKAKKTGGILMQEFFAKSFGGLMSVFESRDRRDLRRSRRKIEMLEKMERK